MRALWVVVAVAAVALCLFFALDEIVEEPADASGLAPVRSIADSKPEESSFAAPAIEEAPKNSECPERRSNQKDLSISEFNAGSRRLAAPMKGSRDPEVLLSAYILENSVDRQLAVESLRAATLLSPNHPLVIWQSILQCSSAQDTSCETEELERLVMRDAGNGAALMELAAVQLKRGQVEEAANTLRSAAAAPAFTTYFLQQAMLLERAFAATTDWNFERRIGTGIGYAAAMPLSFSPVSEQCKEAHSEAAAWSDICARLGEKMYADGRTVLTQSLGLALWEGSFEGQQSDEALRVKRISADFKARFDAVLYRSDVQNLLANDERVARDYLDNFRSAGELEAFIRAGAEADRLKADPQYDQCNFVSSSNDSVTAD